MTDHTIDTILQKYTTEFPVPVMDIAKDLGLKIFLTKDFPDNKAGEIIKNGATYYVHLNADYQYASSRFTLAHEIAHLRLHRPYLDKEKEIEDFVGHTFTLAHRTEKNQAKDKREIEADRLAAEILMPEQSFIRIWNQKETVEEVAKTFDVSPSVAETRARILSERLAVKDVRPAEKY